MAAGVGKTVVPHLFKEFSIYSRCQIEIIAVRSLNKNVSCSGVLFRKYLPTNKLPAFSTACPSRNLCTNQAKDDPPLVSEARKDAKFIQDLASSPAPALWLGLAGAIPFTGLAGLSIITPDHMDFILHAQCGYGACILTFLGAIHWGYALCNKSELELDWRTLGYGVTPSLVAWSALLVKPQYGLVTIAIGLLYALSKDLGTVWFPGWYHALRKVLTTIATSSVILTAVTAYIHL